MSQANPAGRQPAADSSVSVREMRARMIVDEVLRHRAAVHSVQDIASLPRLANWMPHVREIAIADAVADGRLTESPSGRLEINGAA